MIRIMKFYRCSTNSTLIITVSHECERHGFTCHDVELVYAARGWRMISFAVKG